MDRDLLKYYLDHGLSLPQIGVLVNRDPSTVGYWVTKYGLVANGRDKYAPKGGIVREVLAQLADEGASLNEMAEELGLSTSTVRHWLKKYGLGTGGGRSRVSSRKAREEGLAELTKECPHHGKVTFRLDSRGYYTCFKCRTDAVAKRRRNMKRILAQEAGGRCRLCGYDRYVGALHFHHVDPSEKSFVLSGNTPSLERMREEAKKCVLLCGNCHAEIEAGMTELGAAAPAAPDS